MKKLKLTKSGKKIIGVLAAIASLLIILLVFMLLSINTDTSKTYDVENLENALMLEYEEFDLKRMDQIDLLHSFGIAKEEIPSSLALMSYNVDKEGNLKPADNFIIIINSDNYQYYYDLISSQIDAILRFETNQEKLELYEKAILKCDKNYVYLIVSKKAKEIENFINC